MIAAVESLPDDLEAIADLVRVNFPWGSLLRGLLLHESPALAALHRLLKPGARFELVLTYDPAHDLGASGDVPLPAVEPGYLESTAVPAYARAGLQLEAWGVLDRAEALAIPSTWGRRLLHGRKRDVWLLTGRRRQ